MNRVSIRLRARPRLALAALSLVLIATLASCKPEGPGESLVISGTVQNSGFGCWVLQSGTDTYELMNLPEKFQKAGVLATIHAKPRPDVASICMVGPIVEVQKIEEGVR